MSRSESQPSGSGMRHINISCRTRRSGSPAKLTARRHNAFQLVLAAINSFHNATLSATQQQAISDWQAWFSTWQPSGDRPKPMLEAIRLLSAIFFMGQLNGVHFEWDKDLHREEEQKGQSAYGITPFPEVGESTWIVLDPAGFHLERDMTSRKIALVSTLLHECCHAFIYKFGCFEECDAAECANETMTTVGMTGHASTWFVLAAFVQTSARKHLHPGIDLEIFHGILQEHEASQQLPEGHEWEWLYIRMSNEEFLNLLSDLKKEKTLEEMRAAYSHLSRIVEQLAAFVTDTGEETSLSGPRSQNRAKDIARADPGPVQTTVDMRSKLAAGQSAVD